MKSKSIRMFEPRLNPLLLAVLAVLAPGTGWGCGCSCSVFDVRTGAMLPTSQGGVAFLEFNFVDQNQNWSGSSNGPAADNGDKRIKTEFFIAGSQYMFSRDWGILAEIPYVDRYFRTTKDASDVVSFSHAGLGDIRLKAIYTGFSSDLSSGLMFGLKLPTGCHDTPGFDRDTQIGTGSTDLLVGTFSRGTFPGGKQWNWFLTGQVDVPILISNDYRPGIELNGIAGIYYNGWSVGSVKIAPVGQIIASHNWNDQGTQANPRDTGYDRVLLTAGVEVDSGPVSIYADIALPVYQDVHGNQLMAQELFTLRVSYSF